jgi:hypothetical protein
MVAAFDVQGLGSEQHGILDRGVYSLKLADVVEYELN